MGSKQLRAFTRTEEHAWRDRVMLENRAADKLDAEIERRARLRHARIKQSLAAGARAPVPPTTLARVNASLYTAPVQAYAVRKTHYERLAGIHYPPESVASFTSSRSGQAFKTRPQSAYERTMLANAAKARPQSAYGGRGLGRETPPFRVARRALTGSGCACAASVRATRRAARAWRGRAQ